MIRMSAFQQSCLLFSKVVCFSADRLNHVATIAIVAEELCSSGFQWGIKAPTEKLNGTLPNTRQGDIGDLVIRKKKLQILLYNTSQIKSTVYKPYQTVSI